MSANRLTTPSSTTNRSAVFAEISVAVDIAPLPAHLNPPGATASRGVDHSNRRPGETQGVGAAGNGKQPPRLAGDGPHFRRNRRGIVTGAESMARLRPHEGANWLRERGVIGARVGLEWGSWPKKRDGRFHPAAFEN